VTAKLLVFEYFCVVDSSTNQERTVDSVQFSRTVPYYSL